MSGVAAVSIPPTCGEIAVLAGGYLLLLASSGRVVRECQLYVKGSDGDGGTRTDGGRSGVLGRLLGESVHDDGRRNRAGVVIGKAENVLLVSLVLLGAYTALAVVFAVKGIVNRDGGDEDGETYQLTILTGTIVNFTYSLLVGVALRFLLLFV